MSEVVIRRMEERDAGVVAHLWYQLSVHHEVYAKYYAVKPGTESTLVEHVRDLMNRNCVFYIAEVGGRIVGFVSGYVVMRNPQLAIERIGKVDNIFVDDSFRGLGIGTKLLEALLTYFKRQGTTYTELSCDFANEKALRLYKKLGFKEQKVMMVREDA